MLGFNGPVGTLAASGVYVGSYDPSLVALSVMTAILAAYGALRVSGAIRTATQTVERYGLLAAGALSLGGGIWAMHFIGMLAFSLPCGMRFDLPMTLGSMLPGILASGVALGIISRATITWRTIAGGGTVLGAGIGAMHYAGMAALRISATLRFDPSWLALSIVVAVVLAIVALGVPFQWRRWQAGPSLGPDLAGAVTMGGAISGVHYVAMAAVQFVPGTGPAMVDGDGLNPGLLATVIVMVTTLSVGAVILGSIAHRYRNLALTLGAANERLRQISKAFETTIESVIITGPDGAVVSVNPAFTQITGYSEAEIKGKNPRFLKSGRQDPAYYQQMWGEIAKTGHWQGEIWNRRKSGEIYPQWLTISAVKDTNGQIQSYVAVAADISSIKQNQDQLNRLLHHNQTILNSAGEGILGIGAGGDVVFVNPAAAAMLGWREAELIGLNAHHRIHHTRADGTACPSATCPVTAVLADGKARTASSDVFWRQDGSSFSVDYTVAAVTAGAVVTGAVMVFRDITERQRNETRVRLAARVFESSPDGIVIADRRHRILSANQALLAAFQYTMAELQGARPALLFSEPLGRAALRQAVRTLAGHGSWEAELIGTRKSGDIFPAAVKVSADRDPDGRVSHYIAIVSDRSEARSAEDRIEYLSRYDPLTALPNLVMLRDYFDIARGSAARSGCGMALVSCNLDNFKHLNDTLGHTLGDVLLREIAKRLRGCVAIGTGDIVCRTGGDEFLILLVDVPAWEAVHASLYAMRAVVSVPVQLGRYPVSVTASFGISRYPEDGDSFDLLFQKADAAVYHAKQSGRNTTRRFEPAMIDFATERLTLKNDLRLAIERNEFVVHYQPLVNLGSGRITGAEALVRWQSPEHGFLLPGRFIPIAEETGLIVPIGLWVLREVCRQGRLWHDAGHSGLRFAVNISAIQLRSGGFVDTVKQVLEESGLPPQWLELELTESVLISEADQTQEVMADLKQMGIRLAIDDFGTGYSSLSYLRKLKTDKLKIDRSFVTDLAGDAESDAIVTTIIQMARTMNMTTLAEGVETEAQAAQLKHYGCNEVQGYLFGRPVPAEEFSRLVQPRHGTVEPGPSPTPVPAP